jgi:hypothetical protein
VWGKSKNKNRAGETLERTNIRAPRKFEKKIRARDYISKNYQHKQKMLKKYSYKLKKSPPPPPPPSLF